MSHIKYFKTQEEFNNGLSQLKYPWVSFIQKSEDVLYKTPLVKNCITDGYFSVEGNVFKTSSEIPFVMTLIKDFGAVFFGNKDENGNTIEDKKYKSFSIVDDTYLTDVQKEQIIDILNNTPVTRNLSYLKLKGFKFPNKDVKIVRYGETDDSAYYDYSHDMMSGSSFNKVSITNKKGNISSMNTLFRNANIKQIDFIEDGGIFRPTDIAGMVEFNNVLTDFPNTIDYQNCTNIGYTWETCYALKEIPSFHTVTTESERLSTIENIIGNNSGVKFAEQAFNACTGLQKIGPVINCKNLKPNSSGQPYLMFNGCNQLSDLRLKNLSNGDWNFESIFNMDLDSIKYAVENTMAQYDNNWVNDVPSTVVGSKITFDNNVDYLTFNWPVSTTATGDERLPIKASQFQVTIPSGYVLRIHGYDNNKCYSGETLTVTGTSTVSFTNSNSVYPCFVLTNSNGTYIRPSDARDLSISIKYNTSSGYSENIVPGYNHKLTFSGKNADKISDKTIISADLIRDLNSKGWTLYTDVFEVTPDSDKFSLSYRFNFKNEWELNPDLANDVEVNDSSITIKKFRPNVWIIRSKESMNNSQLSTKFAGIKMNINGVSNHASNIFSYRFYSNGCVGGDGGTKGSICGVGILPFSLHSTPTTYIAPELPFSAYVWDSATKTDGSTVQIGSETSAWRGDWGCGYNGYGFRNDQGKKLIYPNITKFATPYENHKLAIGLYTGNVHTFDRWWADGGPRPYLTKVNPFKATISQRTTSSTAKMLATQEVFENVKFKFTNMQPGDSIKWSHTTSKIVNANGETITEITEDGIYTVSNTGVDGGFILYGDTSLSGTNPVTVEILDNPSYIDSEGYIDISNQPITIDLIYDQVAS